MGVQFVAGCLGPFEPVAQIFIPTLGGFVRRIWDTLKAEYSKTQGRTVALYWKRSVEAVRDYLHERTKGGVQPTTPVFSGNYSAMRKLLQRLGQRVLGKSLPYHLLRHSSATYYATKLNRQELCYRYGWKFSSNMPDVYISRAGMETKQLDERFRRPNSMP